MSTPEPPADPTQPPPPPPSVPPTGGTPPPPPPPPAGSYAAPGAPVAGAGVGAPGTLLDRFLARLLDFVIVGIPVAILNFVLTAISDSWLLANLITAVVDAAAFLGYFAWMEANRGQTIGKQVLKLKVVGPGGGNPTMEQAVRRNLWTGLAILNVIPILGPLVGFVLYVVALVLIVTGINKLPERRHWFDGFAGGTQVIKVG